jgi:phytanoyl-CoA hydroxylase
MASKNDLGPPLPSSGTSNLGRVQLQRLSSADWPKLDETKKIYESASVPELDDDTFKEDVIFRDPSGNVIVFDEITENSTAKEVESDGKRKRTQTTFYGHERDDEGSDSDDYDDDSSDGDEDDGSMVYVEEGDYEEGDSKAKKMKGDNTTQKGVRNRQASVVNKTRCKLSSGEQYLTNEQVKEFARNGYLVIENFWDEPTVATLRSRIHTIINKLDLDKEKTVFSTDDQSRDSGSYFMGSGRAIRYFWEEGAKDEQDNFIYPKEECINKIGHGLHDLDKEFEKVTYEKRMAIICRELGLEIPLAVQSMFIFKQKYIGGPVSAHQDGTFLYTEPQTCIGFWWALDDCNKNNGCLYAIPGSHRYGVKNQFRRKKARDDSAGAEFWDTEKNRVVDGRQTWNLKLAQPLEIPRGSLVILHNAVVHYSDGNVSDRARYAYSVHVVDGKEGVVYPKDNWLQRPNKHPFREIGMSGPKDAFTPGEQEVTLPPPAPVTMAKGATKGGKEGKGAAKGGKEGKGATKGGKGGKGGK